jgi:3-oxoacyl-[acyl-carrier-protein] synthase III
MSSKLALEGMPLQVLGTGSALPGPPLTTEMLLARVSPYLTPGNVSLARRLARRLAIGSRHLSRSLAQPVEGTRPEDSGPRLAARALRKAFDGARFDSDTVDFLIGHTATPHTLLPSNTAWTADELGFAGPHLELRQACTGFAAAALTAAGLLRSGAQVVAVVGSETGSVFFDPRQAAQDAGQLVNLVQMGDGAGAVLFGPLESPSASRIELIFYGSSGLGRAPALSQVDGGSGSPRVGDTGVPHFNHQFQDIRAHGFELLRTALRAAASAGIDARTIDWFIPHQVNGRLPELCAAHLGLPGERVVCEADALGNLGSGAIWVALDRLRNSKRLAPNARVLVLGAEATKFLYGGFLYVHGTS